VALKHFDVKANNGLFTNDGTAAGQNGFKLTRDGQPVPHSIFLHVPIRGSAEVSYPLSGKWTAFRATVGCPKIEANTGDPESPLTFEVIGDGRSLWKSEPVTKIETFQTCVVKVEKVRTLTLRVHCPDKDGWGRTVWYEPVLAE
jgi:hypothetical protein